MAETKKSTSEGQQEQLPTTPEEFATVDPSLIFKGVNPIQGQSPLDDYSLQLPEQPYLAEAASASFGERSPLDDYILNLPSVDNSFYWPNRSNENTNLRTQKAIFADDDGVLPGPDQVSYMLQSRKDKDLERLLSEDKAIKLREERNNYLRSIIQASGGNIPQPVIDLISGMNTNQFKDYMTNPKVVLEKEYANAVLNKSIFASIIDNESPIGTTDQNKLADNVDKGSEVLAKREIIDNIIRDVEERYEGQTTLGKVGSVAGMIAKTVVPFMNQAIEGSVVQGAVGLKRMSWESARYQAMVRLSLLPADKYKEALLKMAGEMESGVTGNILDTIEFLKAVRDHTYSDSFWDNVWFGVDAAATLPFGALGKGVGKTVAKIVPDKVADAVVDTLIVNGKPVTVVVPKVTPKGELVPVDRFPKTSLIDDSDFIIKPETRELVPMTNPSAAKLDRSSSERFIIPGRNPRPPGRDRRPKLGPETGDEQIIAGTKVVSDIQLDQIKTIWADSMQEAIEAITKAGGKISPPKELAKAIDETVTQKTGSKQVKVFHGSETGLNKPDIKNNKEGPGYYVTESNDVAKSYATKKGTVKEHFISIPDNQLVDLDTKFKDLPPSKKDRVIISLKENGIDVEKNSKIGNIEFDVNDSLRGIMYELDDTTKIKLTESLKNKGFKASTYMGASDNERNIRNYVIFSNDKTGADNVIKGVVNSHNAANPNPAAILSAAGNTQAAAKVNVAVAANSIQNVLVPVPHPNLSNLQQTVAAQQTAIRNNWLPSFLTPSLASFQNGSVLSVNASNTLWQALQGSLTAATRSTGTDALKVARLTPEALQVAFREAEEYLTKRLSFASNSLLNLRTLDIDPLKTAKNVGSVVWTMGRPDGSLFPSEKMARHFARIWYDQGGRRLRATDVGSNNIGLGNKEFTIKQEGNGWVVEVTRTLDETSPNVRQALVNMDNSSPNGWMNTYFGRFIFGDKNFTSNFQNLNRRTASSRTGEIRHLAKEIIEAPYRALQKNERKDLSRFMNKWMTYQDPNNPKVIGKYFLNTHDLEQEYRNMFNRLPSNREINAYFSWKSGNDFDHFLRNNNLYKERSTQGLEHFTIDLNREVIDPQSGAPVISKVNSKLNAKLVDDLPYKSRDEAVIAVIGPKVVGQITDVQYYKMSKMTPQQKAAIKDLKDIDNYSILHVENPADKSIMKLFGNDEFQPNFIVTKGWERSPLDYNQLNYNQGGHQVYTSEFFGKSPVMVKVGNSWEYRGDITLFAQNTQAEAQKFSKAFNDARLLLKNNSGQLRVFLQNNLPYTLQEFKGLFKQHNANGGVLDIDAPIMYTKSGSYTSDIHNKELRNLYPEFTDRIRNEHNLMNELDKKFLGERDPILHSIKEKGTPGNPIFSLEQATLADPLHVAADAMANSARNMFFGDYKVSAVNSWIAEFKHLLNNTGEEMRGNPLKAVYEPSYRDNAVNRTELNKAENARRAIVNLLGTPSEASREAENLNMKIMNLVYKNMGQKASDFISEAELPFVKNPISFARQMVFHKTMGMFNWTQFFAQAATVMNVVAISPKQGLKAAEAMIPLHLALHSENPANLGRVLGAVKGSGWSRQGLLEVYRELKESGWYRIEGDHTYLDVIKGAGRVETGVGKVLDQGLMFFRAGERQSRIAAYTTAFLEHRATSSLPLTNLDRQRILNRASTLTANMTRDANSIWQTGALSISSQFMSYPVRMAELMLGHELNWKEKARLFFANSVMFGVPAAATLVVPLSLHDTIKEHLYNNGIDTDANVITHALFEGIPAAASKYFLGKDYNFGRYGPGGIKIFEDLLLKGDKGILDLMLGMTYGETRKAVESLYPVVLHFADAIQTGSNPMVLTAFTPAEYLDVGRNISTISNMAKAYIAMKMGSFISKGEVLLDKADSYDAFISLMFGINPRELDNAQILMDSMKHKKERVDELSKEVVKFLRRSVEDYSNGNKESGDTNHRRASTVMYLADMDTEDRNRVFARAMNGYEHLADKIPFEFVKKGGRNTGKRMEMLYGK